MSTKPNGKTRLSTAGKRLRRVGVTTASLRRIEKYMVKYARQEYDLDAKEALAVAKACIEDLRKLAPTAS